MEETSEYLPEGYFLKVKLQSYYNYTVYLFLSSVSFDANLWRNPLFAFAQQV